MLRALFIIFMHQSQFLSWHSHCLKFTPAACTQCSTSTFGSQTSITPPPKKKKNRMEWRESRETCIQFWHSPGMCVLLTALFSDYNCGHTGLIWDSAFTTAFILHTVAAMKISRFRPSCSRGDCLHTPTLALSHWISKHCSPPTQMHRAAPSFFFLRRCWSLSPLSQYPLSGENLSAPSCREHI